MRKPTKLAGGSEQKRPSHPLPRVVATAAVAPPPAQAVPDQPRPSPARIRWPDAPLPSPAFFPLSLALRRPQKRNPSRHRVRARRRSAIAGAPSRHCRIASTSSCASTSSPSSPSLASREDVISPPSSKHRCDTDRRSSSIPSSPASLRP